MDLPKHTYKQVLELTEEAERLDDEGDLPGARNFYEKALSLLPEPQEQWEAWTWICATVGDTFFEEGDYAQTRSWFKSALLGPDAVGNPFIHLRLGQSALEEGDNEAALDDLLRAYMAEGTEIFEEEDNKYIYYLKSNIRL